MGIFNHQHYWRPKTDINRVMSAENKELASSVLIIESCDCGAIRQIEYKPGEAPKIFVTLMPMTNTNEQ